ncbi:MAG TPA: hypothetical protein VNJ52_05080 [Patescibacteria group bacterium]|nr:hypothetical protein [Patescibacteria group bacterium]
MWKEEFEAAVHELNAKAALSQAKDKRDLMAQVSKEADAIEARIAELVKKEEKGFWLCENGHESNGSKDVRIVSGHPPADPKQCEKCGATLKFVKRSEMTGQEQYESDKERNEAEKVLQSKRDYAEKQLPEEIKQHETTASHFQRQAAQSRAFADRLRKL